jgi:AraC-like DNA-binding protein
MRPADISTRVFSTAGLPAARRVELWESHNASVLIGLAVHATAPLEATERNVQLSRVHLARVTGTAHVVERSAEAIRRDPADAVAVYLPLRGRSWFEQGDGKYALRPGDAIACDADRPFIRGFTRGLEELVVKVPRVSAETRGLAPVVISGDRYHPYARALARMAGHATHADHPVPADEATVLDLVAVLVAGRRAVSAVAHRAAARAYIEDHLTEADLGAARIAAAVGVSERQLSRVFAADGTSVPRHILARRLGLAYALLAAAPGELPVAEVAARCGFTSAAYFSHAFARHFGQRASEVRGSF